MLRIFFVFVLVGTLVACSNFTSETSGTMTDEIETPINQEEMPEAAERQGDQSLEQFEETESPIVNEEHLITTPDNEDDKTPSPMLPNMLVVNNGYVQVSRFKSTVFVPVHIGSTFQRWDRIRVENGNVAIFCGDETLWDKTPHSLNLGEGGVPCLKGRSPRPDPEISKLRGGDGITDILHSEEIPYILSPRSGPILTREPSIRWHTISTATTYNITLIGGETEFSIEIPESEITYPITEIPYPDGWNLLEEGGGFTYALQIEWEGQHTTVQDFPRFWYMNADKIHEIDRIKETLQTLSLDELPLKLLIAELYMHDEYRLHSDAVALLLSIDEGDNIITVQQLLGENYVQMKLFSEAETALLNTIQIAEADGYLEDLAHGKEWLGIVCCISGKMTESERYWKEASQQYLDIGLEEQSKYIEQSISDLENLCSD